MATKEKTMTTDSMQDVERTFKDRLAYLGRFLWRDRSGVVGLLMFLVVVFAAVFAPLIAPYDPLEQNLRAAKMPPAWSAEGSWEHPLGTDNLGRDLLSRLIYGARVSLTVGFFGVLIAASLGMIFGAIAGYVGGRVDNIIMRITDVFYAFPNLLLYIILMVTMRDTPIGKLLNGLFLLFVALAVVNWVGVARLVRGSVLSLREKEFVDAARCIGAGHLRIIFRHILPNILGPCIVAQTLAIPGYIMTEAYLSFIGLGITPPTPSWGMMINTGVQALRSHPHLVTFPAITLSLTVLAFNFLGDGLRDALDPRLRI